MIIDALAHVHPKPTAFGPNHDLSLDFLIKNLEESPVDRAVITAIAADNEYGTETEFIAECCDAHPDKLIGFCSVDPINDTDATQKLDHYVSGLGMQGLKLHPRHQLFSPDDPRVVPIVKKAADLGIPVAICGSQWKHAPLTNQMPLRIDDLAKKVPEARIIVCHAGGFRFMDAFVLAVSNDNVFLETSIALNYFHGTPFEDQFMFVLKELGPDRIIYGSDHPEDPLKECYTRSKSILEAHGFDQRDCQKIFGENLLSLLPA